MSKSQKEAVTNAVLSLFPEYELGGETILASIITSDHKSQLKAILAAGFEAGEIAMTEQAKAKYIGDEKAMLKYCGGLLDNWIRKNPEFNNGQKYVTKNPGSRAGSGDEQVRELRKLLKTVTGTEHEAQVKAALDARLAEIKPKSVVTINVDALPESLRHLVKSE